VDWSRLMREEARISAVAPVEAINALAGMLPDTPARERALAMAAAVLMIEPTLHNPRSEIIELLFGMLGVEPGRVMALAYRMTEPIVHPLPAAPIDKPVAETGVPPSPGVPRRRRGAAPGARSAAGPRRRALPTPA
jgi:hypothetical protein